jgi:DNA-directed RNA polymerase specialized sigma24 family protein
LVGSGGGIASRRAFLYRILANLVLGHQRRQIRQPFDAFDHVDAALVGPGGPAAPGLAL